MPQQSLSDFVSAMEAAGMLVRVKDEKRVDELPRVMEDHPTTAVLVEKITGCEFSFLANAYSNQDQYAWAMGCKKSETGMKMVEVSLGRIKPVAVGTAPCKEVVMKGDDVDMTIFPMFLHHERDGPIHVPHQERARVRYDLHVPSCSYQRPEGGREG
jgi:2,5-furandicarboxylate decarboxylase 1